MSIGKLFIRRVRPSLQSIGCVKQTSNLGKPNTVERCQSFMQDRCKSPDMPRPTCALREPGRESLNATWSLEMTETPISRSIRRLFAGGGAAGLALLALPAEIGRAHV